MEKYFELAIVIPTYNEEKRITLKKYFDFLRDHNDVMLCFVNDGSTDDTKKLLHNIELSAHKNVKIIEHRKNSGKAAAVLSGFQFCNKNVRYNKIAYLDADLATSLESCYEVSTEIEGETSFAFGSRIRKLDSFIRRKPYRFLIGRFMATLISRQLGLYVYDTQCGCKVFSRQLAEEISQEDFVSTWLFDVEIFHRIQNLYSKQILLRTSKEVPLRSWIDKNNSKVSFTYFFRMWFELLMIQRKYRVKKTSEPQVVLSEATA